MLQGVAVCCSVLQRVAGSQDSVLMANAAGIDQIRVAVVAVCFSV